MDVLRAFILVHLAIVERERGRIRTEGIQPMSAKLSAVASAMDKLNHGLDERADKLLKRIESVDGRADVAFGKAHERLDQNDTALDSVDAMIADLEKASNHAPLESSAASLPQPSPTVVPFAEKKT